MEKDAMQVTLKENEKYREFVSKIAAEMGSRYTDALKANEAIIARNVTTNLFDRHILPIFG